MRILQLHKKAKKQKSQKESEFSVESKFYFLNEDLTTLQKGKKTKKPKGE